MCEPEQECTIQTSTEHSEPHVDLEDIVKEVLNHKLGGH